MPRIQPTRTVKIAMFFLRAYLVLLFGLILCKGIGLFLASPDDPAPAPGLNTPATGTDTAAKAP